MECTRTLIDAAAALARNANSRCVPLAELVYRMRAMGFGKDAFIQAFRAGTEERRLLPQGDKVLLFLEGELDEMSDSESGAD